MCRGVARVRRRGEERLQARVELRGANGCERRDGRFVVTGRDPYFVFTVPGTPQRIATVAIAGVAR